MNSKSDFFHDLLDLFGVDCSCECITDGGGRVPHVIVALTTLEVERNQTRYGKKLLE